MSKLILWPNPPTAAKPPSSASGHRGAERRQNKYKDLVNVSFVPDDAYGDEKLVHITENPLRSVITANPVARFSLGTNYNRLSAPGKLEIEDLLDQIRNYKKNINQLFQDKKEYQTKLRNAERLNAQAFRMLEEFKEANTSMCTAKSSQNRSSLTSEDKSIVILRETVKKNARVISQQQNMLQELKHNARHTKITEAEIELQIYAVEVGRLRKMVAKLGQNATLSDSQKAHYEAESTKLKDQLASLEAKYQKSKDSLAQITEEKKKLEGALIEIDEDSSNKHSEAKRLKILEGQLQQALGAKEDAIRQINELKNALDSCEIKLAEMQKSSNQKLAVHKSSWNEREASLEAKIVELQNESSNLKSVILELESKQSGSKTNSSLQEVLEKTQRELEAQSRSAETARAELQKALVIQEELESRLKMSEEGVEITRSRLQQEIFVLTEALQREKERSSDTKSIIKRLEITNRDLSAQLDNAKAVSQPMQAQDTEEIEEFIEQDHSMEIPEEVESPPSAITEEFDYFEDDTSKNDQAEERFRF